jgi:hypothetical protein
MIGSRAVAKEPMLKWCGIRVLQGKDADQRVRVLTFVLVGVDCRLDRVERWEQICVARSLQAR